MDKKDLLIEKLKEYIILLENHTRRYDLNNPSYQELRGEISALDAEIKQEQIERDFDYGKWKQEQIDDSGLYFIDEDAPGKVDDKRKDLDEL